MRQETARAECWRDSGRGSGGSTGWAAGGSGPSTQHHEGAVVGIGLALHVGVVHTGIGHELFDTVSLSAIDWSVVVAGALGPVLVIDQMKRDRVRQRTRGAPPPD